MSCSKAAARVGCGLFVSGGQSGYTTIRLSNRYIGSTVGTDEDGRVDCSSCAGDRARVGTLTGIVCILANVALCAAKGAIGVLSGSVSIVADAMNNLSDASSNIVSVLGFKLASKPADPEHPYGHGRYEYLSGLVVAALVLLIGVELVKSSVERVIHPEPVEFSLALVAVLVLSMVVKLWMAALNQKLGDRIESETLHATAQDSKNDVLPQAPCWRAQLFRR